VINALFHGGNEGIASDTISVIDVALSELKANANHEPLWEIPCASTRYVMALYASELSMSPSDEKLAGFYDDSDDSKVATRSVFAKKTECKRSIGRRTSA